MPAAVTSKPTPVTWLSGWLVKSRTAVPTIMSRTPSMTIMAPATDKVMTSRTLLAVARSERTAQRSHRHYRPASHTGRSTSYDRVL